MLGTTIREVRKTRGLTMVQLAESAGVSQGLISQVENGRADPSLETLRRIAEALGAPLFDLFQDGAPSPVNVLRAGNRASVTTPTGSLTYEKLSPPSATLEVLRGRLEPNDVSSREPHAHPASECVVVESGSMVVEVAGERIELEAGDSATYDSRLPHRYLNESDERTVFLVLASPPSF
ncbi:helix-turn-helix domain-containing protein [Gordonia sp. DT101]|uniref:helix-turn-helix domain-containing protein n=1 Tax=Gordonia sp. DT101 TaxID=3416545 RepID=UPI003CF16B75